MTPPCGITLEDGDLKIVLFFAPPTQEAYVAVHCAEHLTLHEALKLADLLIQAVDYTLELKTAVDHEQR